MFTRLTRRRSRCFIINNKRSQKFDERPHRRGFFIGKNSMRNPSAIAANKGRGAVAHARAVELVCAVAF